MREDVYLIFKKDDGYKVCIAIEGGGVGTQQQL